MKVLDFKYKENFYQYIHIESFNNKEDEIMNIFSNYFIWKFYERKVISDELYLKTKPLRIKYGYTI